jgi:tetratricopeptide (TPR) repeat protein
VDGQYQVKTRQQDGFTGLASPAVRTERTSDRLFVGRTAARLIEHDFGAVATIDPGSVPASSNPSRSIDVTVTFKGSGLRVPIDRWVKAGEVFAIARVFASRGGESSYRVPWALLQANDAPKNGRCSCRLYSRLVDPLAPGGSTLGYRCIKLGTTTAPLRIRLVNNQNFGPLTDFAPQVKIGQESFDATPSEELVPSEDGLITSTKSYTNIAFVTVSRDGRALALIPVEILGDRIIVCPISSDATAALLAELDLRRKRLVSQLNEELAVSTQLFTDISQLVSQDNKEEALSRAKQGAEAVEKDISSGKIDLATLRAAIRDSNVENKLPLKQVDNLISQLQERLEKLQAFTGKLKKVRADDLDPQRAAWAERVEQAGLLEKIADFDQAIKIYERVLKELPEGGQKPELQKHYESLKTVWNKASDNTELAKARKFIYEVWPGVNSVKGLSDNVEEARSAFDVCKNAGDYLTPQKLLVSFPKQAPLLAARLDQLKQLENHEDAVAEAKRVDDLVQKLKQLETDIAKFVKDSTESK